MVWREVLAVQCRQANMRVYPCNQGVGAHNGVRRLGGGFDANPSACAQYVTAVAMPARLRSNQTSASGGYCLWAPRRSANDHLLINGSVQDRAGPTPSPNLVAPTRVRTGWARRNFWSHVPHPFMRTTDALQTRYCACSSRTLPRCAPAPFLPGRNVWMRWGSCQGVVIRVANTAESGGNRGSPFDLVLFSGDRHSTRLGIYDARPLATPPARRPQSPLAMSCRSRPINSGDRARSPDLSTITRTTMFQAAL